ncbi:MAG TPA: alpha/beta fold hydrolase [Methylococcaceae bacterium]|nr:alpha/beta fold hydrolase [Methylococcaceae bacterium]
MNEQKYEDQWFEMDKTTYDWSLRAFRTLKKMLKVNIKLHGGSDKIQQGSIFLFNHFSRIETFIPQYLIHETTGDYCWSIASSEFFDDDSILSTYLKKLGVVPHDHQRLFPLLAKQILHGQKIIIFPEGGMVKDHRVIDDSGGFQMFDQMSGVIRKQHTGAAVLAQGIEAFKATVRNAYRKKNVSKLRYWQETLEFENLDALLMSVAKPTLIVPSNITFYPIRSSDNVLLKAVEFIAGGLTLKQTEELLVEGNIISRDTDMDVTMGQMVDPYRVWHPWNHSLLELVASEFNSLDEVFALHQKPKYFKQKVLGQYFRKNAKATRNQYMKIIYANVTINLSHLAATLIISCYQKGQFEVNKEQFYKALYLSIKALQKHDNLRLHASLLNTEEYQQLLSGKNVRLLHFFAVAKKQNLIEEDDTNYFLKEKLNDSHDFLTIRMENLIAVYQNEVAPVALVGKAIRQAFKDAAKISNKQLALALFDDHCVSRQWDKNYFSKPKFDDINQYENIKVDASPFLLMPKHNNGCGILLVHGLLASPAEVRGLGEQFYKQGYTVLGVCIKGHGTSPHDLRTRTAEDWYHSITQAYEILEHLVNQIVLIGFSTGGALALKMAAEHKPHIIAVVAVSVPIHFVNSEMMLASLLHGTNQLVSWVSSHEGVKPFLHNDPENISVNYCSIPVRSLYELRRLIHELLILLSKINIPVLLIYSKNDPIVAIKSADIILNKLITDEKALHIIHADHHGILFKNTENIWQRIEDFVSDAWVYKDSHNSGKITMLNELKKVV